MSKNNENKLVPRLRFPEFKNTQAWLLRTLNDVADMYQPKTISQSEFKDKGHLVYGANGVIGYYDRYNHETSQIAIACRGSSCGTVNFTEPKSWITGNAMVVNVDGFKGIDKKFMFYQLLVANFNYLITGSGQPQITGNIKNHKVVLTNLEEQQKIAACLSSLDDVITAESKKLEVLKEHKKGLLQNLFPQEGETVPKLRFKEFENSGEWEVKTLGEVFTSFSGGTPSTSKKMYYEGSIPFIRSAEINKTSTELFLTDLGLRNSSAKMVSKGDLLVALYGANSGDVAISKIEGAINQAILCLKSEFSNSFVYHYLSGKKSWIVSKYIQGGQGNLSGEIVKSISVSFPSKPEQQKIAACLSSLDDLINAQSQKIETLKLHKKGLLQGLFPNINEQNG